MDTPEISLKTNEKVRICFAATVTPGRELADYSVTPSVRGRFAEKKFKKEILIDSSQKLRNGLEIGSMSSLNLFRNDIRTPECSDINSDKSSFVNIILIQNKKTWLRFRDQIKMKYQ